MLQILAFTFDQHTLIWFSIFLTQVMTFITSTTLIESSQLEYIYFKIHNTIMHWEPKHIKTQKHFLSHDIENFTKDKMNITIKRCPQTRS
jgi:hypothetical protein